MNLFEKTHITKILQTKKNKGEIHYFEVYPTKIFIKKSKRSSATLNIESIKPNELVRILSKQIPPANIINIQNFYQKLL